MCFFDLSLVKQEAVKARICAGNSFRQRLVKFWHGRCQLKSLYAHLASSVCALCRWEVQNPTNMHLITSPEEFKERVRLAKGENTLVVVDYFAPWCHACKSLHPKVQNLAKSYRDVTFLSVRRDRLAHYSTGNKFLQGICKLSCMCIELYACVCR